MNDAETSPLAALRPRRVAVLRALQLGDLLCAVPALRALRAALPDAEVTLVSLPWAAAFAERFPRYLDGFLALPGYPGLPEVEPDARALTAALAEAQGRSFDVVLQLHGSGEVTNPLAVLLGGRRTAGFYRPGSFCPDPELFVPYVDEGPEPRRLLHLLEQLGIPLAGDELEFPLHDDDRAAAETLIDAAGGPYACLHPGSRLQSRRWPLERFAGIGDELARRGLRVVLTGSDAERPLTGAVASAMRGPALDLAGRTTLGSLAALLSGAALLVGNDTGVSHLAAALGVPSVVVFLVSDRERWAPLDGDRHRAVSALVEGDGAVLAQAEQLLELGR